MATVHEAQWCLRGLVVSEGPSRGKGSTGPWRSCCGEGHSGRLRGQERPEPTHREMSGREQTSGGWSHRVSHLLTSTLKFTHHWGRAGVRVRTS